MSAGDVCDVFALHLHLKKMFLKVKCSFIDYFFGMLVLSELWTYFSLKVCQFGYKITSRKSWNSFSLCKNSIRAFFTRQFSIRIALQERDAKSFVDTSSGLGKVRSPTINKQLIVLAAKFARKHQHVNRIFFIYCFYKE